METITSPPTIESIQQAMRLILAASQYANLDGDTRVSGRLSDIASDLDSVLSGAILEAIQI